MPKRKISKKGPHVAARPRMNSQGQWGRGLKRETANRLKREGARFGPHNDSAPDPTPKTKKPFNPFNTGARVDEAKKGKSPFG